jgi:hypothetical protein
VAGTGGYWRTSHHHAPAIPITRCISKTVKGRCAIDSRGRRTECQQRSVSRLQPVGASLARHFSAPKDTNPHQPGSFSGGAERCGSVPHSYSRRGEQWISFSKPVAFDRGLVCLWSASTGFWSPLNDTLATTVLPSGWLWFAFGHVAKIEKILKPVGFGGSTGNNFPHNQISKSLIGYVWLGLVNFGYVWLSRRPRGTKRNAPAFPITKTAITKTGCLWLCSVAFGCVWLFAAAPVTKNRCNFGARIRGGTKRNDLVPKRNAPLFHPPKLSTLRSNPADQEARRGHRLWQSHPQLCDATQPPVRRDTGAVAQLRPFAARQMTKMTFLNIGK